MKIVKKLIPIFVCCFMIASCQQKTLVDVKNIDNENIEFALKLSHLTSPLIMKGENGAFFFETINGRTWVNSQPTIEENTEKAFKAKWSINEREIELIVEEKDSTYVFSFNASPNDGILQWGMNLSATSDEYFTGLFERTVDGDQTESWKAGIKTAMNLRGEEVDMIIKPTLSLYTPFYLSSNNYGMFVDGTWPGHYDFCKSDTSMVKISFEGPSFSGIFYTSPQPAEIVKAHSLKVGPTIVPPKWAFLPWRWRDNHVHLPKYYDGTAVNSPYNSQLVEDILMMKAYDIPCGLYWVDRPWAKDPHGYADFDWDEKRFPKAVEMIDWLHKQDIKFMLWIAPWVTGNMRDTAMAKGYSQPMVTHLNYDSTSLALLDFTNPEACKWWQETGIEKMLKQGVDGFKLDRAEETITESRNITVSDGRTSREVRNEYPVLYVKTVNESCKKIKGEDFVLIPRAAYTGSSKYSGFWGGDIGSPQEGLRAAIIAMLRSAIIGFPIWGSDIGGYWQGDLEREVCARWLAFGAFNPIMEVGPTEDRAPWDMDTEPNYDTELIAIWRLYAKIHAQLADYTHNMAKEANQTGMPIAQPLFLQYPNQKEAWDDWQTFMYGNDILVSAIWKKGKTKHKFYLPKGNRWVDAWDKNNIKEGGQWMEMDAPLYKIPIFIKEGATIDLGDLEALYKESMELAKQKPDLKELEKKAFE